MSTDAIADVLGDERQRSIIWFTFWQAAVSTALTVAIGLVPAYVLARFRFAGRRTVLALVTVPFVLPTVVVGAAFLALLPTLHRQTVAAIIAAHVWINLAVVVRTVGRVGAASIHSSTMPPARSGPRRWQAMRHVTLPLLRPAIVASATIMFLFCFTSFGVIRVLGGPSHVTLEVEVWRRHSRPAPDRRGAVLRSQLLAVTGLMVVGACPTAPCGHVAVDPSARGGAPHERAALARRGHGGQSARRWSAMPLVAARRIVHQGDGRLAAWRALAADAGDGPANRPVADPLGHRGSRLCASPSPPP